MSQVQNCSLTAKSSQGEANVCRRQLELLDCKSCGVFQFEESVLLAKDKNSSNGGLQRGDELVSNCVNINCKISEHILHINIYLFLP